MEFYEKFSKYSNVELLKILKTEEEYQPLAIEVAKKIISERKISPEERQEVENYFKQKNENQEKNDLILNSIMARFNAIDSLTKYSWLISLGLLLAGFFMLYYDLVEYGATFFVLFPLSLGFAMGTIEDENHRKVSYQILSVVVFMGFLLANALEGLVCVFMALPIFALMVNIGYRFQKRRKKKINSNKLLVTISPLIILFFIDKIEQVIIGKPETVTITNSIILNYEPEQVLMQLKK